MDDIVNALVGRLKASQALVVRGIDNCQIIRRGGELGNVSLPKHNVGVVDLSNGGQVIHMDSVLSIDGYIFLPDLIQQFQSVLFPLFVGGYKIVAK